MHLTTKLLSMLLLCVCFVPESLQAQAPQLLNYQGRLDSSGTAINGARNILFSVYDALTGGTQLWTETQSGVTVTNGVFSVLLGSATPFPGTLFAGMGDRYLETSVGGAVLSPRFRFTSVAYALRSSAADNVGSSQWTTAGSNIYYNLGNVGIGTTSPAQKLSVFGSESNPDGFAAAIGLANTAPNGRNWYLRAGATGTSTPIGGFSIADDIAYRLAIDTSGNVGIGTTNPRSRLEVIGAIDVSDYINASAFFPNNNLDLRGVGTGGVFVNRGQGGGGFRVFDGSTGELFRITSSGNVGIGTTVPGRRLDVRGTSPQVAGFYSTDPNRVEISIQNLAPGGRDYRIEQVTDSSLRIRDGVDGSLDLTITSAGNVGIGTPSPSSKLHVSAPEGAVTLGLTDGLSGYTELVYQDETSGNGKWSTGVLADLFSTASLRNAWYVYQNSDINEASVGAYRLVINNSGNVGIGTTSPIFPLEVAFSPPTNNINPVAVFKAVGATSSAGAIRFQNTNNNHFNVGITQGDAFAIGYNSNISLPGDLLRITSAGNVGIRTLTPGNILTVQQGSATDPIADAWTTYSSRRWKTKIQPIQGALGKVQSLRGVSFDWKANSKHDIGLIAEEVGEVIPEVVAYEGNGDDAKSVDYARLVAVLIEAVKEQQEEIEELKAAVKVLAAGQQGTGTKLVGEVR